MKLLITTAANGYVVTAQDTIKNNGTYVFNAVEYLKMVTFVAEVVMDKKARAEFAKDGSVKVEQK